MTRLPPYTVREDGRAKRLRVKLTAREGLVVVVPRGTDRSRIPGILEEHEETIRQALEQQQNTVEQARREGLLKPETVELPCIGERWTVRYDHRPSAYIELRQRKGRLEIQGPDENAVIRRLLRDWLKGKARRHITPLMEEQAHRCGLSYSRLQFRIQKTRWGSCSTTGTISLNACLLFLEPHLVRHVLIHELCHSVHMNHSDAFWELVGRFDPNWREYRGVLKESFRSVPLWVGHTGEEP
ncbi:MAG: M48 family metallopeptidase [Synergistales bacterium]|nr:M48 family metallopeptidase [Synergistales bacterium]